MPNRTVRKHGNRAVRRQGNRAAGSAASGYRKPGTDHPECAATGPSGSTREAARDRALTAQISDDNDRPQPSSPGPWHSGPPTGRQAAGSWDPTAPGDRVNAVTLDRDLATSPRDLAFPRCHINVDHPPRAAAQKAGSGSGPEDEPWQRRETCAVAPARNTRHGDDPGNEPGQQLRTRAVTAAQDTNHRGGSDNGLAAARRGTVAAARATGCGVARRGAVGVGVRSGGVGPRLDELR